jgi:hypothetical protein
MARRRRSVIIQELSNHSPRSFFSKELLMRRNGHSGETESGSWSSGWLGGLFSLVGGVGIGAGLLYLLDPDKGQKRRERILGSAGDLASQARDYAGEALGGIGGKVGNMLGSAREYAGEKLQGVSDYAHDRAGDVRDFAQRRVFGETRAEHRVGVTICALSSMALGAALMYAFDPASGKTRRRYVRDKAGELASAAGGYAHQAGEAIKSGVEQAREKVSGAASSSERFGAST